RGERRGREAQRLVDAGHGGVVVLGRQQRGEQPDRRADGEEADDGVAFCERTGQGTGRGAVVGAGVRPGGEPPGGGVARFRHADQADHRWPQRTNTGFCAARRGGPPGSGAGGGAWSWTPSAGWPRLASRAAVSPTRCTAASVTATVRGLASRIAAASAAWSPPPAKTASAGGRPVSASGARPWWTRRRTWW